MPLGEYTKEEMGQMIKDMRDVCSSFYHQAQKIGNHPFIEFCGLMSKYVDLCEHAMVNGIQFPFASKHSGNALPAEGHDMKYLAEKFDCIFGTSLQKPELRAEFFNEMGWDNGPVRAFDGTLWGVCGGQLEFIKHEFLHDKLSNERSVKLTFTDHDVQAAHSEQLKDGKYYELTFPIAEE